MPKQFRAYDPDAFLGEISAFPWERRIWRVDLHPTFRPDHARWREIGSEAAVKGMWRAHTVERGFADIAQHVSIMPDGEIWAGRDWNMTPASVGFGLNRGVFMIETVGNFDAGCDSLEGAQLDSVITVIRGVQALFRLPAEALLFHREVPQTEKSCPGTSVKKADILGQVRACRLPAVGVLPELHELPLLAPSECGALVSAA
jgi:hypothetical protein